MASQGVIYISHCFPHFPGMFLYNVHTPSKTFALPQEDTEDYKTLVDRIVRKAGLSEDAGSALHSRKDGAGIVYEYQGKRWSLEDDSDLEILKTRLPPSSGPSATLHVSLPGHHAHFASSPPGYTASSALKSKLKKPKATADKEASPLPTLAPPLGQPNGRSVSGKSAASGRSSKSGVKSKDYGVKESDATAPPVAGETLTVVGHTDAKSVKSTTSRRSKYGGDDREPWSESHKRAWHEFHNSTGVRTVMGKVGDVENVRMLLKPGYRGVYVSRTFAIKNKLVPAKYAMGLSGYSGLKSLGQIPITVGGKTASHPAMINEEMHFDVVLGRTWVEKMGIKIDPMDQTVLTYMDSGEPIPCDIVVLKDSAGNKIHIT